MASASTGSSRRIVYIAESALPSRAANGVHVMKMCAAFAALGHAVTLLVPARRGESERGVGDVFAFYGVKPAFRLRRLPWLPLPGRTQIYGWMAAAAAAAARPDLVYGRSVAGCAAAAKLGRRTILESHIPVWLARGREERYFRALVRSPALEALVVISGALKKLYVDKGFLPAEMIRVAHDAADEPGAAPPRADWPGRPGALQAGYAGQLHAGKGVELVAELAGRMPETDFHVVGGDADALRRWRARGVPPNLVMHGFVPPAGVSGCIARFDVCLLPNRRAVRPHGRGPALADIGEYTSPLKLFEYMAHGKAIVASDLPVLREVLHARNAVLVPPDDIEAWCGAIRRLHDPRARAAVGARARADFEAAYTWQRRAAAVLAGVARPVAT